MTSFEINENEEGNRIKKTFHLNFPKLPSDFSSFFFFKIHPLKIINLASECYTLISITVSGIVYVISLVTTSQHDNSLILSISQHNSLPGQVKWQIYGGECTAPVLCKHGAQHYWRALQLGEGSSMSCHVNNGCPSHVSILDHNKSQTCPAEL